MSRFIISISSWFVVELGKPFLANSPWANPSSHFRHISLSGFGKEHWEKDLERMCCLLAQFFLMHINFQWVNTMMRPPKGIGFCLSPVWKIHSRISLWVSSAFFFHEALNYAAIIEEWYYSWGTNSYKGWAKCRVPVGKAARVQLRTKSSTKREAGGMSCREAR